MRIPSVGVVVFLVVVGAADVVLAGPKEDLFSACLTGNLEGAKQALAAGAQPNSLDAAGNSAIAAAFFWPDVTALLLEKGANPNLGNGKAVFAAAANYSTETLKVLLAAGADPNLPTISDPRVTIRTMIAAERAKGKAANQIMISAWESAMAQQKPVESYALQATIYGTSCVPCVEMLLAKGARVDLGTGDANMMHVVANSFSTTKAQWKGGYPQGKKNMEAFGLRLPTWYAAELPDDRLGTPSQVIKLLVQKGVDINAKNKAGLTPLEVALNGGLGNKRELLLGLVENGADVKIDNKTFGPLILQAAQCGYPEVVKAMVERGADLNQRGGAFTDGSKTLALETFTPLTAAAMRNHTEVVKYLLSAGANASAAVDGKIVSAKGCLANIKGKTAIFFAAENNNLEMVKAIVEAKAYDGQPYTYTAARMTNCIGGGGYVPSGWAKANQASPATVTYLQEHGY